MHCCGEGIVGRLTLVNMVVGMHRVFRADGPSRYLNSPVGDNFVGVHVGLSSATGLPNSQGEMIIQFSFDHFIGGLADQVFDIFR